MDRDIYRIQLSSHSDSSVTSSSLRRNNVVSNRDFSTRHPLSNRGHSHPSESWSQNRTNHGQHGEQSNVPMWQNAPQENQNNFRNRSIPRAKDEWGYKRLESLSTQDAERILEVLANDKNGFPNLVKKDLSFGETYFLVQILAKICTYGYQEHVQNHLIAGACEPNFLQKLATYTGKLLDTQSTISLLQSRRRERLEDKPETKISFLSNLYILFNFVSLKMPRTACEQLSNNINACNVILLTSKSVYKFDFPQELHNSFNSLKDQFDRMTEEYDMNRTASEDQPYDLLGHLERQQRILPPNDFRTMSDVPTYEDLLDFKEPFLRSNVVIGAYKNVDDYLDIQYRLLREDFVGPLREGIEEYLKSMLAEGRNRKARFNNIRIYNGVRFISSTVERGFIVYSVKFDLQNLRRVRWDSTKRLIFGSLLCLSKNDFKDIILASVQNRELKDLQKGIVKIKLEGTNLPLDVANSVYVMAESDVYFEAYRHVLAALKKYNEDNFPMERYIIIGKHRVNIPKYFRDKIDDDIVYNLQCVKSLESDQKIIPSLETARDALMTHDNHKMSNVLPINVLKPFDWPSAQVFGLDQSQHHALKSALTKEFVVIQGPPGTGKTFIGLKIVQALLANSRVWNERPMCPIFLVCYTNHALDQFLEGMLTFTHSVVRIGSRSKCDVLNNFNLSNLKRYGTGLSSLVSRDVCDRIRNLRQKVHTCHEQYQIIQHILDEIKRQHGIVHEKLLLDNEIISDTIYSTLLRQFRIPGSYESDQSVLRLWLGFPYTAAYNHWEDFGDPVMDTTVMDSCIETTDIDEIDDDKVVMSEDKVEILEDEFYDVNEDRGDERLIEIDDIMSDTIVDQIKPRNILSISYSTLKQELGYINQQIGLIKADGASQGVHPQDIKGYLYPLYFRMEFLKLQLDRLHTTLSLWKPVYLHQRDEAVLVPNFCTLPLMQRWHLYSHWIKKLLDKLSQKLSLLKKQYANIQALLTESETLENVHILRHSKIVGMTTTGAAKHNILLTLLKPKIVVIEEAAEVLEAHIVTSLTKNCQHLILIGDHRQLRPSVSYQLARKHFFDISLFERMIKNGMDCPKLEIQHRMRPEIASLIVPAIYPSLQNDVSVMNYPDINGVGKNIFFLSHNEYEEEVSDTSSRANRHEAEFMIQFCRYLILQGYDPTRITLLTTYTGQLFLLRKLRSYHEICMPVRVTVVDNYQGEENDIILLSLVRNNREGRIGFLKTENRVCVALSRAKMGFYILGNINILAENSDLWKKIRSILESQKAIDTRLRLCCQVHSNITYVSKGDDFTRIPEGGCTELCQLLLQCGHTCKIVCHPYDRQHEKYVCTDPCKKLLCELGHRCPDVCGLDCKPCNVMVNKVNTSCFHEYDMPCHVDPGKATCIKRCDDLPPCGHECMLYCHVKTDPDHILTKCYNPCEKKFAGCDHPCAKLCWEECGNCKVLVIKQMPSCKHETGVPCYVDPSTIDCQVLVKKTLPKCRHETGVPCNVDPWIINCQVMVKKKLPNCQHETDVLCYVNPGIIECKEMCQKELPCKHPCRNKCNQKCGPCQKNVDKAIPDCGHEVKAKCSSTPTRDMCKKKCERLLPCGHKCTKMCKDQCGSCPEKVAADRIIPCGHKILVQCSEFQTAKEINMDHLLKMCTYPCQTTSSCGHKCAGTCGKCLQGRIHIPCTENCDKKLVCGHKCADKCGKVCPPCRRKCQFHCDHRKCGKDCGNLCEECRKPCGWRCEHKMCTKKCFEKCDREPCNEPCKRRLKCSCHAGEHLCIGYCGEPCPTLCRICNSDKLEEMIMGEQTEEEEPRYIFLPDCRHTIRAGVMDKWMATEQNTIGLKECPQCYKPITYCPRYNNIIKTSFRDIVFVKARLFGAPSEIQNIQKQLIKEISGETAFLPLKDELLRKLSKSANSYKQSGKGKQKYDFSFIQMDRMTLNTIEIKVKLMTRISSISKNVQSLGVKFETLKEFLIKADSIIKQLMQRETICPEELTCIKNEVARLNRFQEWLMLKEHIGKLDSLYSQFLVSGELTQIPNLLNSVDKFEGTCATRVYTLLQSIAERYRNTIVEIIPDEEEEDNLLNSTAHLVLTQRSLFDKIQSRKAELKKHTAALQKRRAIVICSPEEIDVPVACVASEKGTWFKCTNNHLYCAETCSTVCLQCNKN